MSRSYQQEIPQARVNITLDVETGGAKSKKELPMKLLVLGDFSHGQASGSIAEREPVSINRHNFNQILAAIQPKLTLSVPDRLQQEAEEMPVHLTFSDFAHFKPQHIVEQVPQLKRLMAMRNLLKDLKSCVIDNQAFRKALEKIMKDTANAEQVLQELSEKSPLNQLETIN